MVKMGGGKSRLMRYFTNASSAEILENRWFERGYLDIRKQKTNQTCDHLADRKYILFFWSRCNHAIHSSVPARSVLPRASTLKQLECGSRLRAKDFLLN